jgi:hypothetical protein
MHQQKEQLVTTKTPAKTTAKKSAAKKTPGVRESFKIIEKRSGRWSVLDRATRKFVNGAEKLKILVAKGLVKAPAAKATPAEAGTEA